MSEQARRAMPPKRVRHPAGCSFASGCFPPRLATTQLPSATCVTTSHKLDFHPPDKTTSRTPFALRYQGRRRVHNADEIMAEIVAKRLVEHLERAGFVVMKRPAIGGGGAGVRNAPPFLDCFRSSGQ